MDGFNIVAVIPAKIENKGMPNKNIRLVNGKPLVYYSIVNALSSSFIHRVIVTTDSDEIECIAKQMGAEVIRRGVELCGDEVLLDDVVIDVLNGIEFDVCVTLQATSPTLKLETLDGAIGSFVSKDIDTLVSVTEAKSLGWTVDANGSSVPNYVSRAAQIDLPEYYVENGAFVISRAEVLKQGARFGSKVEIHRIPEDEAIEVQHFHDLKTCEQILSNQKVAFYVNGNNKRGLGHIYRCLELADEFYVKPDIYFDSNQTDPRLFGSTSHNLIGVNGISELFNILKEKKYDIFINDVLNTTVDYMIALKDCNPAKKIINFEDDGEGVLYSDLTVNALYENPTLSQMRAGEKYYICSKTFLFYSPIAINESVRSVFISFGGADPQDYSDRLINIVNQDKYKAFKFIVVLGRAKKNVDELMKFNSVENIEVLYDVRNMPELMMKCDIAITSRGRTGYELALLGVPTIAMAQNKREEKHGFVSHENGFNYLGLNPPDSIIESNLDMYISLGGEERKIIQNQLLEHDLRNGRKRVFNLINSF
ncbi:cytidyltransferase [Vibrio sp. YMD68]|uniref:cytidylyltransferase domain-containing protein n=1 Tax=Vibrio sp. YMD68 TaxID=3042300 RepID=UPI00249BD7D6|nr:cytidyltransferase [Vibrio sp. YMD68]WGW00502.1 cytidyltransferase [Vibrio sp. YMD68]